MSPGLETARESFIDRRCSDISQRTPLMERRQFADSFDNLSPEAQNWAKPSTSTS